MTEDKHFKAAVRARAKRTGETYAQAKMALVARRGIRQKAGKVDPRTRAMEWINQFAFIAEKDPAPIILENPSEPEIRQAVAATANAATSDEVNVVKRMQIWESLKELRLHAAHEIYFGIGRCEELGRAAWYLTKRGSMPLVWLGAYGEDALDLEIQDGEVSQAFDQALLCIGGGYQATDADNGELSIAQLDDDMAAFIDGRGFDYTPWEVEERYVVEPDHVVFKGGVNDERRQHEPAWYEGGVVIRFSENEDDEGTSQICVLEGDGPSTAWEAVRYFHALRRFDRALESMLTPTERYDIALAFCLGAECGVTALPVPVPGDNEDAADQVMTGIHGIVITE